MISARRLLTHALLLTTLLNSVAWAWYASPHMLTGHCVAHHHALGESESWDGGPYGADHFCSQGICHLIGHLVGFILTQAEAPAAPFDPPVSLYRLRLITADIPPPLKPPRA